jgi:hypothetical protein
MRRLAILIAAASPRAVEEALDDVVAAVATGQQSGQIDEGDTRIRFSWDGDGTEAALTEEIAELLRLAWEAGLDMDTIYEDGFRLALRKIRGSVPQS